MQAVVDRNLSIEALKKELEMVEDEKTRLAGEIVGLRMARGDFENLQGQVNSLGKDLEGAKATEQLTAKHALKALERSITSTRRLMLKGSLVRP
jgi:hypothetical protein